MSEVETIESLPVAAPRSGRTLAWVFVLLVLALVAATGLLARDASATRDELAGLQARLDQEHSDAGAKATAIDAAFSPLAMNHAKAAKALLGKGNKKAAEAELERAQTVAVSVRDLGSGRPPGELVVALTEVEKALGRPPTLAPPPMMGGG